jgi:hypothetical protein
MSESSLSFFKTTNLLKFMIYPGGGTASAILLGKKNKLGKAVGH